MSMADLLLSLGQSAARTAELNAKTAHRMAALANSEAAKVNDKDPLKDREALQGVAALVKISNEAMASPLGLLNANKEATAKAAAQEQAEKPAPVRERLGLADWKKAHGIG